MKHPPENHRCFGKPTNWLCDRHGEIDIYKCDKCDIMRCHKCLIWSVLIGSGNVIDLCEKCMDKLIKDELSAKNKIDMFLYQKD